MNVLIIEDELPSARHLQRRIEQLDPKTNILAMLDSVEQAVSWFRDNEHPDLVFMDIQLGDGSSFQIFDHVEVDSPVIFTTAFDEYALKAFQVKSIDYLLKPILLEDLSRALDKFRDLSRRRIDHKELLAELRDQFVPASYQERLLIKVGDQFKYLKTAEIHHLQIRSGLVEVVDVAGKTHFLDEKMEAIYDKLNPKLFFRINRQQVIHVDGIEKIHAYFNGRLKLTLKEGTEDRWIVARDRVKDFKIWLEQ